MFKLPDLPYPLDALEPHISAQTMGIHHGKHHAAYINKLNEALKARAEAPKTMEEVVRLAVREKDAKLFNNAAQAWNHGFFWQSLAPEKQAEPQGDLRNALDSAFGSLSAFRDEAKKKGEAHFASGWLWLVSDAQGAVSLRDLHDADTPIAHDGLTALLVCDLWEHAYYLDYKNERGKFLDAFLNSLANWRFAEAQYAAVRAANADTRGWRFPV